MLRRCSSRGFCLLGALRAGCAGDSTTLGAPPTTNTALEYTTSAYPCIGGSKEALRPGKGRWIPHNFFSSAASPSLGHLKEFRLAQTGEGIKECELLRWFVAEGDTVDEFERMCEVQSDKATIEITSPFAGVVRALRHSPGAVVQVGDVLADILSASTSSSEEQQQTESNKTIEHSHSKESSENRTTHSSSEGAAVMTSPAVRRAAKELGVDLAVVVGTGPGGRVTKADILTYTGNTHAGSHQTSTAPPPQHLEDARPPSSSELISEDEDQQQQSQFPTTQQSVVSSQTEDKVIPLRGYRRAMVKSMTAAAAIPHFHFCDEVDVGSIVELRQGVREARALGGARLTYLPFFIKAAAAALVDYPTLNASLTTDGESIIQYGAVNIGVAVATPLGLVVPNIKDVGSLSIAGIAQELARLQSAAAANQLRPEDIAGGTFTLSNIGTVGGTYATPLVNPPEVAIMALGKIQKVPRYAPDGVTVVPAQVMSISVGADHRVADGAAVAGFTQAWKALVENPGLMLLGLR